jgi:hypothetical protein
VLADQVDETIDGLGLRDVEFDCGFTDVEIDLTWCAADVAEIGIRHFARAIDDAAHDGDFDAFEMFGAVFDAGGDRLEVKEGAAAAGAGHVVGLEAPAAGGLEDIEGQAQALSRPGFFTDEDGVADAVGEQGSEDDGRSEQGGLGVAGCAFGLERIFEEDWVGAAEFSKAGGEEAEGSDGGEGGMVGDGDQLSVAGNGERLGGVDVLELEFFVDGFGSDVVAGADVWGDPVIGGAGDDDADGLGAAAADGRGQVEFGGWSAGVAEGVEGGLCGFRVDGGGLGEGGDLGDEVLADGDFVGRIFGERDSEGVAESVAEERANADGTFDAAVLAFPGFGDPDVDGIVPVRARLIELGDEQAVAFDHDLGIAGLHGEDERVEVVFAGDASELEGALDHAGWGIAVAVEDAVAEGAVIRADTEGATQAAAELYQGGELFLEPGEFGLVFGVGVLADGEFFTVGVVAGVDADFFDPACGFEGGFGFKVDVGDDGHEALLVAQGFDDVFEVGGVFDCGGGDADEAAAGPDEIEGFADATFGVHGVAGDHGLGHDGVVAADDEASSFRVADGDLPGEAASEGVEGGAIVHGGRASRWRVRGVGVEPSAVGRR